MPARQGQQLDPAGLPGRQQTQGIIKRHHVILFAMHQQHRAAHASHAANRRNVVKARPNDPLHMAQHIPADAKEGNVMRRQQAPHDLVRVGKGADADHGPNIGAPRGAQQGRTRADRMPDHRQTGGIYRRLPGQPIEARFDVLRKTRQRGKGFVTAGSMAARIQQQHRKTSASQGGDRGQHHAGIGAPTVHHQHGG